MSLPRLRVSSSLPGPTEAWPSAGGASRRAGYQPGEHQEAGYLPQGHLHWRLAPWLPGALALEGLHHLPPLGLPPLAPLHQPSGVPGVTIPGAAMQGNHLSQVTTIGDSSLQTKFEAAPEGSLYNLMWDKKFEEKNKSLVKKIEDTIPIVHGGEVKSLFCSPITNFSLQCIYQNR